MNRLEDITVDTDFLSIDTPPMHHPEATQQSSTRLHVREYSPINYNNRSEIRLLHILPAKTWDEEIRCCLKTVSLFDSTIYYEALSYTWQDLRGTIPISIDGMLHSVSLNLASFLRRRRVTLGVKKKPDTGEKKEADENAGWQQVKRKKMKIKTAVKASNSRLRPVEHKDPESESETVVIWIDALCINQTDDIEKAHQVRLMGDIYLNARKLWIWLGEEENNSNIAMNLVRQLGMPEYAADKVWTMSDDEILALDCLFQRRWWTRIWIVQELVNGGSVKPEGNVVVLCGWLSLPWSYIAVAAERLNVHNSELRQQLRHLQPIIELEDTRRNIYQTLFPLLVQHRGREASDPRDKVYGLMGLAVEGEELPGNVSNVSVDYRKSTVQLYADIALSLIHSSTGLELLKHCQGQPLDGLPSWAPGWPHASDYALLHSDEYKASGSHTSSVRHLREQSALDADGVLFDTILSVGELFPTGVSEPWQNSTYFMLNVSNCRKVFLDEYTGPDPYVIVGGRTRAFWQALTAGYVICTKEDCKDRGSRNIDSYLPRIPSHWKPRGPRKTGTDKTFSDSLAALWENGIYDLNASPFLLPSVVPDPFEHLRSKDDLGLGSYEDPKRPGLEKYALGRRLIVTQNGYMGLGPPETQRKDKIAVLFGSTVPFVLRERSESGNGFQIVGEAYVEGIMNGEVMEGIRGGEMRKRTFRIF
ncbi:uncharacterized protein LY89DRAFT_399668 [Mollisia scopiformis]|uniref:Heterokaryon incompatibility domain-containing protein n=1 Tax=Mollisia scopiformis TaxID=149040 RepID=A0A132B3A0_MOLSC|nr:uncharacterized protein LY89DRAFT_399668 [Mollisia scopiformis]KUJ06872.1 hypothetical protein LY89DRAFT_399668 [Mollisia scopiformis]